jgi:hypothetical protein
MPLLRGRAPTSSAQFVPAKAHWVVGQHHAGEQRKRAVVQLHRHAFERLQRRRDFQQLQDDRLIRPEEVAVGNAKDQGVPNVACCTGNGDAHRCLHFLSPLINMKEHIIENDSE